MKNYRNIDEYIQSFPTEVGALLEKMRKTIRKAAPEAEEAIAYGIPTFKLNGNLVHFGGYKTHIGFYPAPLGIKAFQEELSPYQSGKGTVQFPLDAPIPYALVAKITKYRVQQNLEKKK